MTLSSSNNR